MSVGHMTVEDRPSGQPEWWQVLLIGRRPKYTLIRILVLVVVVFTIATFVLWPIRVEGASMMPNYRSGRINFVNRLAYLRHGPQRGDVVAIRLTGRSVMYMKRIIGLPGETVAFFRGQVFINGELLDEPYVKYPCDWNRPPVRLESDEYFFVGDNRSMPMRDHEMGRQHRHRIMGKVLL